MRRTSAWTRSRLICVAVFLLADLSGCDKKQASSSVTPAEPVGELFAVEEPKKDSSGELLAPVEAVASEDASVLDVLVDTKDAEAAEPAVEPIMQLRVKQVEVLQDEVQAVREVRAAAKRASTKVYSLDAQADDMGELVLDQRYARLDSWAQKKGWSLDVVPEEASRDAQMQQWWQEWRHLKMRAEAKMEAKQ